MDKKIEVRFLNWWCKECDTECGITKLDSAKVDFIANFIFVIVSSVAAQVQG